MYDIVIVGAGVAGCALAHALSSPSLKIALLERSLAEPDRIVGELLQPAGVLCLRNLGLEHCLDGIDSVPVKGYCVVSTSQNRQVHIPYLPGCDGRSFHHGRFITKLREAARNAPGVEVIETTVNELLHASGNRVVGVKTSSGELRAHLVIVADGCFSNFRSSLMSSSPVKAVTKSHFVGLVLQDATLPYPQHGTVGLVEKSGPVLLYQIGGRETRLLVDIKAPLPSDIQKHILTHIVPQLPSSLQPPIKTALEKDRIRRMPNSFLPPVDQSRLPEMNGVFLVGDAYNMRHPLTGGGMTVAFNDVVILRDLLRPLGRTSARYSDQKALKHALSNWFRIRKKVTSTTNILSVALYDLFAADAYELAVLREGCFKYFERGGECVTGPVGLLSGVTPSPFLLFRHFFTVALYGIWIMLTQHTKKHGILTAPFVALRVFYVACIVFVPLLWTEIRSTSNKSPLWLPGIVCTAIALYAASAYGQYNIDSLEHLSRKVGYNVSLWD